MIFMIFMIFFMKNQKISKSLKIFVFYLESSKMFCHIEIHWGGLGRRNIDHETSMPKLDFFKNKVYVGASGPHIPSHVWQWFSELDI